MNFNLICIVALVLLVVVALLEKFKFKQREIKGKGNENFIISWAYDCWFIVLVIVVVRLFLFEPFSIPSSSMAPTLEKGDFLVVNKFSYGVHLPYMKTIPTGQPNVKRGDVVVFQYPHDTTQNYIKRVIGLPGDHIEYKAGNLFINGQLVETQMSHLDRPADQQDSNPSSIFYMAETIGNHKHFVRHINGVNPVISAYNQATIKQSLNDIPFVANTSPMFINSDGQSWEVTIPTGHYFCLGDNREQSSDSRIWGFVPESNLVGKAVLIVAHKPQDSFFPTLSRSGFID